MVVEEDRVVRGLPADTERFGVVVVTRGAHERLEGEQVGVPTLQGLQILDPAVVVGVQESPNLGVGMPDGRAHEETAGAAAVTGCSVAGWSVDRPSRSHRRHSSSRRS